ncbi:hypothetical protein [uncultured Microscilla sp.]|uniref:hypothetical protein n=1 Tax=uncultured Microscilla sp. TaxID=432653 RepID=UPI002615EB8E|nr:hypothetical protein [uncultured Microscilla sp.]
MKQVHIGDYHKRQRRKASAQAGVVSVSVTTGTLDNGRNKRVVNHARFFSPTHLVAGAHRKKQAIKASSARVRKLTHATVQK